MIEKTDELKNKWFEILGHAYAEAETGSIVLKCDECCPGYLCEKYERVYFLPFEMELIGKITGLNLLESDDIWKLEMPVSDDLSHIVGLKDEHRPCPFFKDNRCAIYRARPFDCRSFPAMPVFHGEAVDLELEQYCPALEFAGCGSIDKFAAFYKRLWETISRNLPESWKFLYWNTSRLVPEIHEPEARPGYLNINGRFW